MARHRALSALSVGVAFLVAVSVASPPRASQAVFTDSAGVGTNTFSSGEWAVYYLHNNPTPPVGNTASQATLPFDRNAPTAATLHNYDTNRDNDPGLMIREGQYQVWLTPQFPGDIAINGDVVVTLWSAMEDFQTGIRGVVTVYLLEVDGANFTQIGTRTVSNANWQGGSATWVERAITVSGVNDTIAAGHQLGLAVFVDSASHNDMWFAYDTQTYRSRVVLP